MLPLNALLIVIIDVLDGNINTLYKIWNTWGQIKLNIFTLFFTRFSVELRY